MDISNTEKKFQLKKLRSETNIGLIECKKTLLKFNYNYKKALNFIKAGFCKNLNLNGRTLSINNVVFEGGIIHSYIHHNKKLGVLIQVQSQTDFTSRNEKFNDLVKSLYTQIVATNSIYINKYSINWNVILQKRYQIYFKYLFFSKTNINLKNQFKTEFLNWLSEICLLEQKYILDNSQTINNIIRSYSKLFKEKILLKKFILYKL